MDNLTEVFNRLNDFKEIYKCDQNICNNEQFNTISELIGHIGSHLKLNKSTEINCLFKSCPQNYCSNSYTGYKSHISRHNDLKTYLNIKDCFKRLNEPEVNILEDNIEMLDNNLDDIVLTDDIDLHEISQEESINLENNYLDKVLEEYYKKMYLKLSSKYLVQKFVIDEIYEDILEILKINNSDFINRIEICTIDGKISTNSSKDISLTSLYGKIHKRYSKSLAKETWKLNTPFFVPPRQIQLDDSDVFHYIPIIDNWKGYILKLTI